MLKQSNRWVALSTLGVLAVTALGGLGTPVAQARHSKKYRNLAILGAAVTGYGLLKGKKSVAIIGGLGTAYAYSKYRKNRKQDRRYGYSTRRYNSYSRNNSRYNNNGYNNNGYNDNGYNNSRYRNNNGYGNDGYSSYAGQRPPGRALGWSGHHPRGRHRGWNKER